MSTGKPSPASHASAVAVVSSPATGSEEDDDDEEEDEENEDKEEEAMLSLKRSVQAPVATASLQRYGPLSGEDLTKFEKIGSDEGALFCYGFVYGLSVVGRFLLRFYSSK